MIPRSGVDLNELCISYRDVGAMGLPREIVEAILGFLHKDIKTLKACSLTCRALFSAARGSIHRKVKLTKEKVYPPPKLVDRIAAKVSQGQRDHEVHLRYLSMARKRGLLGYAQELVIDIRPSFTPEALKVYLPHFLSFVQVRSLEIRRLDLRSFLPVFERCFAQFVPTLRRLHLPDVVGNTQEVVEFTSKFPHLKFLTLTPPPPCHLGDTPPRSPTKRSFLTSGRLTLTGSASARFMLEIPGGLHCRTINASNVDKVELDKILVACSSTLEVFSFCPWPRKFTGRVLLWVAKPFYSLSNVRRHEPEPKFGPKTVGSARGS